MDAEVVDEGSAMTNDPTKSAELVDAEHEVVESELPEPADEQAQELEPEQALAEDAAVEGPAQPLWIFRRRQGGQG